MQVKLDGSMVVCTYDPLHPDESAWLWGLCRLNPEKVPKIMFVANQLRLSYREVYFSTSPDSHHEGTIQLEPGVTALLSALVNKAQGKWLNTDAEHEGVAWVIFDHLGFCYLQRKDGHPNPKCDGKLSLVGGGLEPWESPIQGGLRELYEEAGFHGAPKVAKRWLEGMAYNSMVLPSQPWEGTYRSHNFYAKLFQPELQGYRLLEGQTTILSPGSLQIYLKLEEENPGSQFICGHDRPIRYALKELGF